MKITNNTKMLNDITIVIFAFDRHEELKRKIIFYKKKYKIIILDRSLKSISDFCKIHLNKKSKYLHYPSKSYFERFFLLKKLLKTKYVMLQTDDDYFVEESMLEGIFFLNKNKKFSCVAGGAYRLDVFNNKIYLKSILINNAWTLKSTNYKSRVSSVITGSFDNLYYGVMRRSAFLKHVAILKKNLLIYKDEMYRYNHIQFLIVLAMCGKIKILNKIFYLRNSLAPRRFWPNTHTNMMIDMYYKFKEGNLDIFINNILSSFYRKNNYNNRILLKKKLHTYLFNRKKYKEKIISYKNNFMINLFLKFAPQALKRFFKFTLGWYGRQFDKNWHLKSGIKFSYKNFITIKECREYFNR
jgi:glycosyltransferase domain-containing protein